MYSRIFLMMILVAYVPIQAEVLFTARPTKLDQGERVALELIDKLQDYHNKYQKYFAVNESATRGTWHQQNQAELESMIALFNREPTWDIVVDDAAWMLVRLIADIICQQQPFYNQFVQQIIHSGVLYNERIRYSLLTNVGTCGIRKLLEHGLRLSEDDDHVMVHAVLSSDEELVKTLLSAGGSPNAAVFHGGSALMFAAERNNLTIVRALTDHLETIDEKRHVFDGKTILHYACSTILENLNRDYMRDKHTIIEILLSKGCSINALDKEGATPLVHAIKEHDSYDVEPDQRLIDLIVASGADLLAKDHHGLSALHYAYHKGLKKLIKALLIALEKYQPNNSDAAQAHVHFDINKIIQKNSFCDQLKNYSYGTFDVARTIMFYAGLVHAARALNSRYRLLGIRL